MSGTTASKKDMIRVGGLVSSTTAALRIGGDHLDPDEITKLLDCEPTASHRKGDVSIGKKTGTRVVRKSGLWRLESDQRSLANLDIKIGELLFQVTDDLDIWQHLASKYSLDVFCGVFLDGINQGLELPPQILLELGRRGIDLQLDIYGAEFDDELEGHFARAKAKRDRSLQ
jgi:hypothetical protein